MKFKETLKYIDLDYRLIIDVPHVIDMQIAISQRWIAFWEREKLPSNDDCFQLINRRVRRNRQSCFLKFLKSNPNGL